MPTPDLQNIAQLIYGSAAPAINAQPDAVSGAGEIAAPSGVVDPWATQAASALVPGTPASSAPTPGSVDTTTRTSDSGFSPDKMAQIQADPFQGQAAQAKQQKGARGAVEQKYAPYKQALAQEAQQEQTNEDLARKADIDLINATAEGNREKARLINKHAEWTLQHNEEAAVARQQAKDEYRAKLLEIKEVNPSALWDGAGTSGQIGIAAAAILHEMLGVKGIKTSAMDTINNAVRNNIDAQIANINKQQKVASGFKDLYEMTVAESASEQEARDKMQGYLLQALDKQVDATLAPYNSQVARVKHAQAKSLIRKAALENQFKIDEHIDKAFDQSEARRIQIRGQDLSAAMAKADRMSREKIAQIEADARKTAVDQTKMPAVIYDITESGKGAAKWRFKPEYADDRELQRNVINKTITTKKAIEGMRKIAELQREIGSSAPDKVGRLRSELQRREQAMRSVVVSAMILDASGKAATDQEREQLMKQLPAKDWFTNGNNFKIIADRINEKGTEMTDLLRQTANDVVEGDPAYGTSSAKNIFGEGEQVEASLVKAGADQPAPGAYDEIVKATRSPDALELKIDNSPEFNDFSKPLWQAYRKDNPDGRIDKNPASEFTKHYSSKVDIGQNPTKGFDAVREIAEHAQTDAEARKQLEQLASEVDSSSADQINVDSNIKSYAKWFLTRMEAPSNNSLGYEVFGQ